MLATETLKVKLRQHNLLDDEHFKKLIDDECKLLTSKQLSIMVGLKGRSLFPYCKVGRRIFYPVDEIVKMLHKNKVYAQLR